MFLFHRGDDPGLAKQSTRISGFCLRKASKQFLCWTRLQRGHSASMAKPLWTNTRALHDMPTLENYPNLLLWFKSSAFRVNHVLSLW